MLDEALHPADGRTSAFTVVGGAQVRRVLAEVRDGAGRPRHRHRRGGASLRSAFASSTVVEQTTMTQHAALVASGGVAVSATSAHVEGDARDSWVQGRPWRDSFDPGRIAAGPRLHHGDADGIVPLVHVARTASLLADLEVSTWPDVRAVTGG